MLSFFVACLWCGDKALSEAARIDCLRKARMTLGRVIDPIALVLIVSLAGCVQINAVNYPEPAAQTSNRMFVQTAQLAQILASVSPIQNRILQHYQYEGRYPSSLEELGLDRADMSSGQYIQDLELDAHGNILIEAGAELGEGIFVNLEHEETMGGLQTVWRCKTNLDEAALAGLPGCTHLEDVRKPVPVAQ